MSERELRLRLLLGATLTVAVLLAYGIGVSVLAAVVGTASEANAGVRAGVLGSALPVGLVPAVVVGALAALLYQPATDERRR